MAKMARSEVLAVTRSIVSDILNLPELELTELTTARDVPGWDSLTHVQIIIGAEAAFGIRMSATEVAQLENVASLIDVVQQHQERGADG